MSKLIAYFARLSLALAGVALYQGCNSSVEKQIELKRLAQTCLINTDCESPLVCAFEACHAECESSRDCEDGARCVSAARPYKVCQLAEERDCQHTADCPEGLTCAVDGQCRDKCQVDSDCVELQVCVSGTCADKNELDEQGLLTPTEGVMTGAEGTPCVYVSDCNGALLCRSQACLPECRSDKDCGAHRACQDTRCVEDGTRPKTCHYNSDCETDVGQRCLSGTCLCGCVENRDCPGGQICKDHCACVIDPSIEHECDYNSDCPILGQVCKNSSCDCECKQDTDCGEGQKCNCGCVDERAPNGDGVIAGDVIITSSVQLPIYRGVKIIQGTFTISAPDLIDLGDTFDQLEGIGSNFELQENELVTHLAFPKLKSAGKLEFAATERLLSLELPALETAEVVRLSSAPKLASLVLTNYRSGAIDIAAGLTQLELPALEHATTFSVHDSPYLQSLSAPALLDLMTLKLTDLRALTKASALKLHAVLANNGSVVGDLAIERTGLTSVSALFAGIDTKFSLLSLSFVDNVALRQCDLTAFRDKWVLSVAQSNTISGNLECP